MFIYIWLDRKRLRERKKNIDDIFVAGIHQSKRERERRENNMTNEKIDMNKKYMENI